MKYDINRYAAIWAARIAGGSWSSIARVHNISTERARQIGTRIESRIKFITRLGYTGNFFELMRLYEIHRKATFNFWGAYKRSPTDDESRAAIELYRQFEP